VAFWRGRMGEHGILRSAPGWLQSQRPECREERAAPLAGGPPTRPQPGGTVPCRPERRGARHGRRAGFRRDPGDPDDDAGGPPLSYLADSQGPILLPQCRGHRLRKPWLHLKPSGDGACPELSSPAGFEQVKQPVTGHGAAHAATRGPEARKMPPAHGICARTPFLRSRGSGHRLRQACHVSDKAPALTDPRLLGEGLVSVADDVGEGPGQRCGAPGSERGDRQAVRKWGRQEPYPGDEGTGDR
jgi:hypothetical protein